MSPFFVVVFFILGLIIGSFLNVVIFRLNTSRSFGGRSGCMSCLNKLSWYELIPVLSFVGLRGRCRSCKTKISIQYPLVELATGILFALLFLKFQDILFANLFLFSFTYLYFAVIFSILLIIVVYDLKHKIIPDSLALILGILTLLGLFLFNSNGFYLHLPSILEFSSGLIIASPFAFLWLISSGKWMGLGDAKLAISLGWLLGLSRALSGLVFAFWTGAIIGIILMVFSRKHGLKSEIPFAPFLVLGALLVFFFNLRIF